MTRDPDNARVARLVVRNLRGLVRQALAWGPEAEILDPLEARKMARDMLTELATRLGERKSSHHRQTELAGACSASLRW